MLYTRPHKVLKFGGTSLGRTSAFRNAVRQIRKSVSQGRIVVVASALSEVTDLLAGAIDSGQANEGLSNSLLRRLKNRHLAHAAETLTVESARAYAEHVQESLTAHRAPIRDRQLSKHDILGLGEKLSVPLLALALRDAGVTAVPVDATSLIRVDVGAATVRLPVSIRRIRRWYQSLPDGVVPVVTGFVAGDADGRTVTLGRGGSDYSASLFAAALEAGQLERWTDVDGVYTDDPRRNSNAERISEMSLEAAYEKHQTTGIGIHPRALDPLLAAGIPVHIRSTLRPELQGTWIRPTQSTHEAWPAAVSA
jgi:aspartate kinase